MESIEVTMVLGYDSEGRESLRTAPVYGGDREIKRKLDWYGDGHPTIERIELVTLREVAREEHPCDRRPERIESWYERNGREDPGS